MLGILLGVIAVPAFVFFVFAVALGRNAVKAAAWGAILGMGLIVAMAAMMAHNNR
jgi:hypothetical protein